MRQGIKGTFGWRDVIFGWALTPGLVIAAPFVVLLSLFLTCFVSQLVLRAWITGRPACAWCHRLSEYHSDGALYCPRCGSFFGQPIKKEVAA